MLLLQEQEQLVDNLKELENKLYILSSEHENLLEISDAWCIIYTLLQKEQRKINCVKKRKVS